MNTRVERKIVITDKAGETNFSMFDFSGHNMYLKAWIQMNKIHTAKNSDYSHDSDPLANFKDSVKIGVEPSTGILIRMQDKWARLINVLEKGQAAVLNETVEDTMLDLANYALLFLAAKFDEECAPEDNNKPEEVEAPEGFPILRLEDCIKNGFTSAREFADKEIRRISKGEHSLDNTHNVYIAVIKGITSFYDNMVHIQSYYVGNTHYLYNEHGQLYQTTVVPNA